MSGIPLVFEVDVAHLNQMLGVVTDVLDEDKVLDEAASIILNHTRSRYLQEVTPDGVPWIPSWAGIARRAMGGTGTLFDTGTLWRSIQESASHNPGERIIEAGALDSKGFGYGAPLNFGDPSKRLPARQFMGVPQSDIELFEARIMQRVAEALNL